MAVALIVAAGRGERLGFGGPKALVIVAGRPMLEWSVDAIRGVPAVREIVVALPADRLDAAPEATVAVAGGAVRSESVLAALRASSAAAEPVIVHDAARPLVSAEIFAQALAAVERPGVDAVVAAAPVADTIKQTATAEGAPGAPAAGVPAAGMPAAGGADAGGTAAGGPEAGGPEAGGTEARAPRVTRTLDRHGLWAVQTPQVFRRGVLQAVFADASAELLQRATDDAWLVEQAGGTVVVLPSPAENFKVTTRLDLRLAELILGDRTAGERIGPG